MRIVDKCISKHLAIAIGAIAVDYWIEGHSRSICTLNPLPVLAILDLLEYNILKDIILHLVFHDFRFFLSGIDG